MPVRVYKCYLDDNNNQRIALKVFLNLLKRMGNTLKTSVVSQILHYTEYNGAFEEFKSFTKTH